MVIKNSRALITGSSSGIGAAVAIALARLGCHVAITWARDKEGALNTQKQCSSFGVNTIVCQLDVRNNQQCENVIHQVVKAFGGLDILVNSAGITKHAPLSDLGSVSGDDFLEIYNVNVVGVFQIIRAAEPFLRKQKISHVISVASMAAINGRGSSIAYAASKGALVTMTKTLARALGPEIRVNAICPGIVKSKWAQSTLGKENYEHQIRSATLRSTLKAIPSTDDIANSIVACISGCDLMTGTTFYVDGGSHLGTAHLLKDKNTPV